MPAADEKDKTKRGVIDFTITDVRHRYADKAVRCALGSLTTELAVASMAAKMTEKDIGTIELGTQWLVRTWRARAYQLRKNGWDTLQREGTWRMTVNCPPVGVITKQRAKSCGRRRVCPFCWARKYPYELFDRLEAAYYGTSRESRLDPFTKKVVPIEPRPLDLVELLWTRTYPEQVSFDVMFGDIHAFRGGPSLALASALGSYQLLTIEPPDTRQKKPVWVYQNRFLAMIDPDERTPTETEDLQVRRHHGVDRSVLVGAVGRVCRYPVQMLLGGMDHTVNLLNYFDRYVYPVKEPPKQKFPRDAPPPAPKPAKGFRTSSYKGILRNRASRDREQSN